MPPTPKPIHFVIMTAAWKRPMVMAIFLLQFEALKAYRPDVYKVDLVVAGTRGDKCEALCKKHTDHYFHTNNKPLGSKFNARLEYIRDNFPTCDAVIGLGSDDLLSVSALEVYGRHYRTGTKAVGIKDFYNMNLLRGTMKYTEGYKNVRFGEPVGPGRMLRREVLEQLNWQLHHPRRSRGLDRTMRKRLQKHGVRMRLIHQKEERICMVGLKGKVSLHRYNRTLPGIRMNAKSVITKYFGPQVWAAIRRLKRQPK